MTESEALRILGLTGATSEEEVKRAWRRTVKQTHPDLHPNDPKATERFQSVQDAYDLLRNRVNGVGAAADPAGWNQRPAWSPPSPYRPPERSPARGGAPPPEHHAPADERPSRIPWGAQHGTWRWWAYVVFWKAWAIPFLALLIFGWTNHRAVAAVQDSFRAAPACGSAPVGDGGCVTDLAAEVTTEACAQCRAPSDVGPQPAVTIDVGGVEYVVNVLAPDATSKNKVFAFDHTPGASKVTVRQWKGMVVAVGDVPTTDNPLHSGDRWVWLAAGMLLPIGWVLVLPARIVDLSFRMVAISVLYIFRLIGLSLTRV